MARACVERGFFLRVHVAGVFVFLMKGREGGRKKKSLIGFEERRREDFDFEFS